MVTALRYCKFSGKFTFTFRKKFYFSRKYSVTKFAIAQNGETKKMENTEIKKKKIANEVMLILKKFKLSLMLSVVFFIGYSYHNKLIQISLFDYKLAYFEAEEIFNGYIPSQYVYIEDNVEYVEGTNLKSVVSGHYEISETDYIEVKKEIVSRLLNDSFETTLLALPIIFLILIFFYYILKSLNWVKKYAD